MTQNTTNSISANSTSGAYSEQSEPARTADQNHPTIGFFAVGVAINIAVLIAFFIWAYRQWGKSGKRDE